MSAGHAGLVLLQLAYRHASRKDMRRVRCLAFRPPNRPIDTRELSDRGVKDNDNATKNNVDMICSEGFDLVNRRLIRCRSRLDSLLYQDVLYAIIMINETLPRPIVRRRENETSSESYIPGPRSSPGVAHGRCGASGVRVLGCMRVVFWVETSTFRASRLDELP